MKFVLSSTFFVLLLCGHLAEIDGFTITPAEELYIINPWENARLHFYVVPWPPPCPPCKPLNPTLKKYELVDVHFYNGTVDTEDELCHVRYNNGTFDDTTGKCRQQNSRVQDFNRYVSDGVLLVIENCTIYDQGQFSVAIKYGEPDVSSSTQLNVHFAPPSPDITVEPSHTIQENTAVTLTCKVLSSNPLATLVWERKEHGSVVIPPTYYHSGTSWDDYTISTIEFSVSHRDHGITYECRASNDVADVSSGVALTVLHKPYASVKSCQGTPYYVEEGKTVTFTCEILAYPESDLLVYWYNGTAEISTSNVTSYTIEDFRRYQAGVYACAAQNSEGKGARSNCTIDVQYPPGGPPFDDRVLSEGESITVVCDADANPDVILYSWRRDSDSDFKVENRTLSLRNVNISDADTYTCLASNILTPTGSTEKRFTTPFPMNVFVIFSPRWKQYALNKFTVYLNQRTSSNSPATLVCDAEGYPEVSYEWRFNGGSDPNWVITEVDGKSHLEIATPTTADLGAYLCVAQNTENSVEFDLHLLEPGIPGEPQHCDVEQTAANEVTFRCVAGYAGGAQLGSYVEAEADGRKRSFIPSHTECVEPDSDTDCTLLTIRTRDLYPSTLYTFFLYGENSHGKSQKSLPIQAETKAGDPPPVNPDPGSNVGAMIGATIGAICGLALIIALAAYAFWRYNPKIKDDVNQPLTNDYDEIGRRYAGTRPLSASTLSLHGTDNPACDVPRGPKGHDPYANVSAPAQSRSRRSSGENTSQQNYANHAYEMRGRQTNLAGMGALSHRSKQNLAAPDGGATGTLRRPPSMPQLREEEEEDGGGGGGAVDSWEFPRDKLYLREKIGEGAFGEVWKAAAEGITRTAGMMTVAIKMVTGNAPDEQKRVLLKELDNMKLLKPHPNVVELYGCVTIDDPVYIIMEYIPMGNLHQFLMAGRTPHESARRLSMRDLLTFCSQVATGMDYVSSQGLLHRDLAARNVLLDEKLTCKVCDFGMARDIVTSRQYESKTQRRLPIRWMAPESLFDNIYSTKSDIWSFGVLVWEIITLGSSPYPGMSGPEVMEMIQNGKRMPRPAHCSDVQYTLMRDCWRRQANDRPTFYQLRQKLNAMVKEMEALPKTNFFVTEMEENMYDCILDLPGEKC